MQLKGWNYEGRRISDMLHQQILEMVECLHEPETAGYTWASLQQYIAEALGTKTGQVRTIKRIMEEFGILKKGVLKSGEVPDISSIYTEQGRMLVDLLQIEQLMKQHPTADNLKQAEELQEIYRLYYQKALLFYTCHTEQGLLHPLRATLKALKKYEYLDYWEWYLLNTVICRDDDVQEEAKLNHFIEEYRAGRLLLRDGDVIEHKLSHTYLPSNFAYAGFIQVEGNGHDMRMILNGEARKTIDEIIK